MVKDEVTFPDFHKIDIRVGKIQTAVSVEGSTNLLRLTVDLGSEYGKKTILSGIAKWYTPDELVGKKFLFIANLAPKKIMKEESHGMILAADTDGRAVIIPVNDALPEGTVVR